MKLKNSRNSKNELDFFNLEKNREEVAPGEKDNNTEYEFDFFKLQKSEHLKENIQVSAEDEKKQKKFSLSITGEVSERIFSAFLCAVFLPCSVGTLLALAHGSIFYTAIFAAPIILLGWMVEHHSQRQRAELEEFIGINRNEAECEDNEVIKEIWERENERGTAFEEHTNGRKRALIGGTGRSKSKSAITESIRQQILELNEAYKELRIDSGHDLEDGSLLSCTDHELSEEPLENISNHYGDKGYLAP